MSASVSVDTEWTLMDCHAMVGYWLNHNLYYGVNLCIMVDTKWQKIIAIIYKQCMYTSYRISAYDVHALVYMYLQKLMNVWKEIISVHRTVTTLLVHTSAPVTVVLSLMLMEKLVMVRLYTYYHNSMGITHSVMTNRVLKLLISALGLCV